MKKNGFSLVELLAVLVILGLLAILAIPAFVDVYTGVRRENLYARIREIESVALKYGSKIKDEIKNSDERCITTNVSELISKGYLISEDDKENVIFNPSDSKPLDGEIRICYSIENFDTVAYYTKPFLEYSYYYKGDVVTYFNPTTNKLEMYKCEADYKGVGGLNGTNEKGKFYFKLIKV